MFKSIPAKAYDGLKLNSDGSFILPHGVKFGQESRIPTLGFQDTTITKKAGTEELLILTRESTGAKVILKYKNGWLIDKENSSLTRVIFPGIDSKT